MRLVILESPYAGDIERNLAFARACVVDCLKRGEAPIASHLLYTQPGILDDAEPEERALGIQAGHEWVRKADAMVAYINRGISKGMDMGMKIAHECGIDIEYRVLPDPKWSEGRVDGVYYNKEEK